MKASVRRWIKEQNAAQKQQLLGKTAAQRMKGYRRAESSFAKLMILAIWPVLLAIPFVPWSSASVLGKVVIGTVCVWFIAVLASGLFFMFRSLAQAGRHKDHRS